MICGRCGSSNLSQAHFCGSCGAALGVKKRGGNFEGSSTGLLGLGQPGKDAAERRQLTVLFCDIVGSTSLSERLDPEELRDLICDYQRACLEEVQRNEGHVAQYLGDGILIYFGYPIAHEDEPRRAVRTALAILQSIKDLSRRLQQESGLELSIRIGAHTGHVVVGEIGSGDSRAQLALGEAPNLAARVQNLAERDTIVISAATYQLVKPFFVCEELGSYSVQGKAQPVQLYRVLGETRTKTRIQAAARFGMTPLVGREHENKFLLECWEKAKGGAGQAVLIRGEPGIGKSRAIEELKERLVGDAYQLFECYCSAYQHNTAFAPITDLLSHAIGITPGDSTPEKLFKLSTAMASIEVESKNAVPLIGRLLSLPSPAEYSPLGLTPVRQRQLTLETLKSWLVGHATNLPLLFVVEDLHWADPSTLELLALLVEHQKTKRIMLLVTSRPEFPTLWPTRAGVHVLELSRLNRQETSELAKKVAQTDTLPIGVRQEVIQRTDGVPLFVEEMIKMLLESGFLKRLNGSYELTGPLPHRAIPSTVQDSLMARLDRLGPEKTLAQMGAVLGREFRYDVLQAVSEINEEDLGRGLTGLIDADLITVSGLPPWATYTFKHALVQDAAYESLLRSTRKQYHQRIAEVLERDFPEITESAPELLAQHFTSCGFDQKAIEYWDKARKRALERAANREAIAHLEKALEVLKHLPDKSAAKKIELEFQLSLMAAYMAIEGWASKKVESCCLRTRDLSFQLADKQSLFGATWGLWTVHFLRGEMDAALETADQVLSMAVAANDTMLQVMGHHAVGFTRYFRGELIESNEQAVAGMGLFNLETERRIVHEFQFSSMMALQFFRSASLWVLGWQQEGWRELEKASLLIDKLAHPPTTAAFMAFQCFFYYYPRDSKRMLDTARKLIDLAEDQGFLLWIAVAKIYLGWAFGTEGKTKEGLQQMESGLQLFRQTGTSLTLVGVMAMYAEILRKAGCIDKALAALEDGMAQASLRQERLLEPELYHLRGEIELEQGNEDIAVADFDQALKIAHRQCARSLELRIIMSKCRLLEKQGKKDEARWKLQQVCDSFTEGFNSKDLIDAENLLIELSAP